MLHKCVRGDVVMVYYHPLLERRCAGGVCMDESHFQLSESSNTHTALLNVTNGNSDEILAPVTIKIENIFHQTTISRGLLYLNIHDTFITISTGLF